MFIKEFLANTVLNEHDNEKLSKIQMLYGSHLSEEVTRIISKMNMIDSIFFDDEDFVKLLSVEEVIDASCDMNVDFVKHNIIPIFDIGDNDYISFNLKKCNWCKFNIVDEISFSFKASVDDFFKSEV